MPLDPQLKDVLEFLESMKLPRYSEGTAEEARRQFRWRTVDIRPEHALIPVGGVEDIAVGGADGELPARVYRPQGDARDLSTLAYFHGGGFVIGDLDTHENTCRRLCRDLEAVVVSVAYRLAPEHPFPTPVEDCLAATRWIGDRLDDFGGGSSTFAVGGDSAGGNLATVVTQLVRDTGGPTLDAQLLIYPAVDMRPGAEGRYPSRADHGEGLLLTADTIRWFEQQYISDDAHREDPRASPLLGDLADLPAALVATGVYDPLCSEGDAYAQALADAGVPVVHLRFDGLIHGFFGLTHASDGCEAAAAKICAAFRDLLRA
jgi:acetyl esterase